MNKQLTNLERAVLEMLLLGENAELEILREQFAKATVLKREFTGTGFFTSLEIPIAVPHLQKKDRITITDVSAQLPELERGAGFVLFVDNGAMNCLEGFCYDESWPDSTDNFTLTYLQESPPGSGKLHPSKERDVEFAFKGFATKV